MEEGASPHIALVVPHSNTVMERDFALVRRGRSDFSVWRIRLEDVTPEAEERMLAEELPGCLEEIARTEPELVVFGCTSAGALGGLAHDSAIARSIRSATGSEVVTVVSAMVEQLRMVGPTQVAVFTPYAGALTRTVADCVTEAGFKVVTAIGMGLLDNTEIGRIDPDRIVGFVTDRMQGVYPDAVFLSCTNWRAMEAIDPLTEALGLPVLTSNQVTLEAVGRRES